MEIKAEMFANEASIRSMIRELGGINRSDTKGMTPLCFAAMNGIDPTIIVSLVNNFGADTKIACSKGLLPLECAVSTFTSGPIDALVGTDVPEKDESGNPIDDKTKPLPDSEQPKKDAANNPLPERDDNGDIVYQYYKGVLVPLNEGEKFISDKHQQRCKIDSKVVFVPPASYDLPNDLKFSMITYTFDKDGNHNKMKGSDSKPLKQCYTDGKEIHKKDESGKELKNNFEYVWDYKGLPKYQIAYEYKHISVPSDKAANILNRYIFQASKSPNSDALNALIHKWAGCTSDHCTKNFNVITDFDSEDTLNTPILQATTAGCIDSIKLLKEHDSTFSESVNKLNKSASSAAVVAVNSGDDDLIESLRTFMLPIQTGDGYDRVKSMILSSDIESADDRSALLDMYVPLLLDRHYGSNPDIYDSTHGVLTATCYVLDTQDISGTTVYFPAGKTMLNYLELAVKCLGTHTVMYNALWSEFITSSDDILSARKIYDGSFDLISNECYTILNLLHDNHCFDDKNITNNLNNRNAIVKAVEEDKLNYVKLKGWAEESPWWEYEESVTYQ